VLFSISIALTIQSHSYHNSKWVSSTSFLSSFILDVKYDITSYFNLKVENDNLLKQNLELQEKIIALKDSSNRSRSELPSYSFISAKIISNSYNKKDNFVLINKGREDSIYKGYGISLPNGIMGIVVNSSNNYSRVISILNTNLSINAKLKNSNQFGSLQWDSKFHNEMILKDLPRSAEFKVGDTIVTGGNSLIFPSDLPIGVVKKFDLNENSGYFKILVSLFADMADVNQAYVIVPKKIKEAQELLEGNE